MYVGYTLYVRLAHSILLSRKFTLCISRVYLVYMHWISHAYLMYACVCASVSRVYPCLSCVLYISYICLHSVYLVYTLCIPSSIPCIQLVANVFFYICKLCEGKFCVLINLKYYLGGNLATGKALSIPWENREPDRIPVSCTGESIYLQTLN